MLTLVVLCPFHGRCGLSSVSLCEFKSVVDHDFQNWRMKRRGTGMIQEILPGQSQVSTPSDTTSHHIPTIGRLIGNDAPPPPESTQPLKEALALIGAGISVVPTGYNKKATIKWKSYQSEIADEATVRQLFHSGTHGVARVHGVVSGNLETIDYDCPENYPDNTPQATFSEFSRQVEQHSPGLMDRLTRIKTPKGIHLCYRCESPVERNQKLANVPEIASNGEVVMAHNRTATATLIETRGEGGYAVGPGTPGYNHMSGPPLCEVTTITAADRQTLLTIARSFDQCPEPGRLENYDLKPDEAKGRPGDDFNARGEWGPLLTELGLAVKFPAVAGVTYLHRIGSDHPSGATLGFGGKDLLHVFSSNLQIPHGKSYSKFAVFAHLRNGGDFTAAARALGEQGFGTAASKSVNAVYAVNASAEVKEWGSIVPLTTDTVIIAPQEVKAACRSRKGSLVLRM